MAADRGGVSAPPRTLPLRSKHHRTDIEPANETPDVRIPSNVREVGLRSPFSLGTHLAHRNPTQGRQSMMARAYFLMSSALGWLLRSARYTQPPIVQRNPEPVMRKRRSFYAPL